MKYHGNYCGPNWSNGVAQPSVVGTVPPVDEFDATCMLHDTAYATGQDRSQADDLFYTQNMYHGIKRSMAALLVKGQDILRTPDYLSNIPNLHNPSISTMQKQANKKSSKRRNLRGPNPISLTSNKPQNTLTTVPAAYGFSLRMREPKITRTNNTAIITGSDYAGTVFSSNSSLYEPAASVYLNPIYFNNAMLGNLSRTYEKFRFKKAVVQYVPSVPTSTQGQIIMTSTRSVKEPFIDASSTTFLSRALSQGNAVACPVWKEESIELNGSNDWHVVDALIDGDLDDSIQEEVQVYSTCEATLTTGILILHYEIEFKDPLMVYHATVIPSPVGNGTIVTMVNSAAVNNNTAAITLTSPSTTLSGLGNGAIFRMVFQRVRSTLPTGVGSWSAYARVLTQTAATLTTDTQVATDITSASGSVYYGVWNGANMILYASYEGAAAGEQNDCVFHQTSTTAVGTYSFLIHAVKLGASLRVTTQ